MKYPGRHGHTHRLMTPIEFMARLAALVPPPRFPLVRYHGTLAPHFAAAQSRDSARDRDPDVVLASVGCADGRRT
jgi:hypothetical protein